jgi:cytochrome c553
MIQKVLIVMASLLLFITCTKDVVGPGACFQEDVLPIFISNCTMSGCHNAKDKRAGYDLSNYDGIMQGIKAKHPLRSEIYTTIRGNNPSMPQQPYSKLSAENVNMIKLWINMGARNTSNCSSCDTTNFTYSSRVSNVMKAWCTGCHNATSAGGGFDLSNYQGVVNAAANNKLMGSIKHTSGYLAMPQSGGQLQQCDIDAIQKWINKGFPD